MFYSGLDSIAEYFIRKYHFVCKRTNSGFVVGPNRMVLWAIVGLPMSVDSMEVDALIGFYMASFFRVRRLGMKHRHDDRIFLFNCICDVPYSVPHFVSSGRAVGI